MKKLFFYLLIAAFSVVLFQACETDREGTMDENEGVIEDRTNTETFTEPDNRWDLDRDYTYAEREEYRNELNNTVNEIDKEIQNLENRSENASDDMKAEYQETIDDLKERRDELRTKMNDIDNRTEENWDEFKRDVDGTLSDLGESWNRAMEGLKIDNP